MKRPDPKMNTDRGTDARRGCCPECGKAVMLRNSDGMVRIHGRKPGVYACKGSLKMPSKSAECELVVGWTPARRSN